MNDLPHTLFLSILYSPFFILYSLLCLNPYRTSPSLSLSSPFTLDLLYDSFYESFLYLPMTHLDSLHESLLYLLHDSYGL